MIHGDVVVLTSWVQLVIAVVSLVTALTVWDSRRAIHRHVRDRRRKRRKHRSRS